MPYFEIFNVREVVEVYSHRYAPRYAEYEVCYHQLLCSSHVYMHICIYYQELREGDNWRMDIEVDGHVFKCPFPRPKKKVAKADAAKFVLKELGLYE